MSSQIPMNKPLIRNDRNQYLMNEINNKFIDKSKFELVEIENKGLGYISKKEYKFGELIGTFHPYSQSITKNDENVCDECYKSSIMNRLPSFKTCGKCHYTFYCSTECQRKSWNKWHKVECPLIQRVKKVNGQLDSHSLRTILLVSRMIIRARIEGDAILNIIDQLYSHSNDLSSYQDLNYTKIANGVVLFLQDLPNKLDIYKEYVMKAPVNSLGIMDDGIGLYPEFSFFNHSCVPNASTLFIGNVLQLRAVKHIHIGDEITFSYVINELSHSEKRSDLQESFKFNCTCTKCQEFLKSKSLEKYYLCRHCKIGRVDATEHMGEISCSPCTHCKSSNQDFKYYEDLSEKFMLKYERTLETHNHLTVNLLQQYTSIFHPSDPMINQVILNIDPTSDKIISDCISNRILPQSIGRYDQKFGILAIEISRYCQVMGLNKLAIEFLDIAKKSLISNHPYYVEIISDLSHLSLGLINRGIFNHISQNYCNSLSIQENEKMSDSYFKKLNKHMENPNCMLKKIKKFGCISREYRSDLLIPGLANIEELYLSYMYTINILPKISELFPILRVLVCDLAMASERDFSRITGLQKMPPLNKLFIRLFSWRDEIKRIFTLIERTIRDLSINIRFSNTEHQDSFDQFLKSYATNNLLHLSVTSSQMKIDGSILKNQVSSLTFLEIIGDCVKYKELIEFLNLSNFIRSLYLFIDDIDILNQFLPLLNQKPNIKNVDLCIIFPLNSLDDDIQETPITTTTATTTEIEKWVQLDHVYSFTLRSTNTTLNNFLRANCNAPSLRRLSLSHVLYDNMIYCPNASEELISFLQGSHQVSYLELEINTGEISPKSSEQLSTFLSQCKSLKDLVLNIVNCKNIEQKKYNPFETLLCSKLHESDLEYITIVDYNLLLNSFTFNSTKFHPKLPFKIMNKDDTISYHYDRNGIHYSKKPKSKLLSKLFK
ncbi:hypothetical protein DLAC_02240 [Tieghemostelium lacteum]|uniref:SET domain-containing protein n=1 Tax=Tieghemostelium lacteum TaxID=361077 RepID=A0A152A4H7_TIELA|nr:hypothetical protein DLAC_02240 [Tieghemostelium lacteum]|eukprot:KYR01136.1 hypothetical protein DLAC_02240 [Tieghemostelium lacteum]